MCILSCARSRAGSLATAHLLATHEGWSLYDAVAFLAARRPETEIQRSYIDALEAWAVGTLGRPPSLDRIRQELPKQLRPDPLRPRNQMRAPAPAAAPEDTTPKRAPAQAPADSIATPAAAAAPASPAPLSGGFGTAAVRRAASRHSLGGGAPTAEGA